MPLTLQVIVQPMQAQLMLVDKGSSSQGITRTESLELGDEGSAAASRSALLVRFGGWAQLSSCLLSAPPDASVASDSPGAIDTEGEDAKKGTAGVGGEAAAAASSHLDEEALVGGCVVMDGGSEASFTGCTFVGWAGSCVSAMLGGCVRLTNTLIKVYSKP